MMSDRVNIFNEEELKKAPRCLHNPWAPCVGKWCTGWDKEGNCCYKVAQVQVLKKISEQLKHLKVSVAR